MALPLTTRQTQVLLSLFKQLQSTQLSPIRCLPRGCRAAVSLPVNTCILSNRFVNSITHTADRSDESTNACSHIGISPPKHLSKPQLIDEPDTLYKKIVVKVMGNERAVLNSYTKFIQIVCSELKLNLSDVKITAPVKERFTLLKSAFVHKKHRVQYEARTYYRTYEIQRITGCTADVFLEYLQRNLPEGVAMEVTRHKLERLSKHVQPSNLVSQAIHLEPLPHDHKDDKHSGDSKSEQSDVKPL